MSAWAWKQIVPSLRASRHRVHTLTLPGLDSPDRDVSDISLESHVDAVLSLIARENSRDVIVVGHNYSGLVAGLVADRAPARVAHTVYIEGFVPHDKRSMLDAFPEGQRADELRLIEDSHGRWPVPDVTVVAEGQDLSLGQAEELVERCVGHPGRTVSEPATLTRPVSAQRSTYIVCSMDHFGGHLAPEVSVMREEPNWTFRTLDTGYWPMISAPGELAALLDDIASEHSR
jgi:pimeloyl-ACP methyl ester carboxylesterase